MTDIAAASIAIRQATCDDEAAILRLAPRLLAFGPPPWRDLQTMRATDDETLKSALRETGGNSSVWVATDRRGEVMAFIHLTLATDYYTRTKTAHVADIVVAEEAEGQGVARLLLTKAQTWAQSIGSPWLSIAVFETNARAAALYERLGFKREILRMVLPLHDREKQP